MKKQKYLMSEPVEHIDPGRLAFYLTWERRFRKNQAGRSDNHWRFWLTAIARRFKNF